MSNRPFFAEIIQGSLQHWTAQCWDWQVRPDFASLLVCVDGARSIFGLVYHIQTGSLQAGRTPFAYQKTEEELKRDQPHLFELLQTTCTCLTVGYQEEGQGMNFHYAPQPPKIHAFVRPATRQELVEFFTEDRYLPFLFSYTHQDYNLEELLLALFKVRIDHNCLEYHQLKRFIETFSLLTGNDYRRLKLFLHRIQPLIKETQCSILSKIV